MEEIIEIEQPTFKTMYAVCTIEEYQALNDEIGQAKSYPDEKSDTNFYSDPNPTAIDGLYYMQITAEVQEKYGECLIGITLIESIPNEC
jgi:hypothetical protein